MSYNLPPNICVIRASWKCGLCSQRYYEDDDEFKDHLKRYCHICDIDFTSSKCWQRHQNKKHLARAVQLAQSGQESFYCQYCGEVFTDQELFTGHKDLHHLYSCLGCKQTHLEYPQFCSHANLCKFSWKHMVDKVFF